jgi:trehalose-6-phosphate synthase
VHYLHHFSPREEIVAHYLAADVMLVTSLRDGMNLVAKDYVACRHDETGALVLSEFTGAPDELGSALSGQPARHRGHEDIDAAFHSGDTEECRRRVRSLRKRVRNYDVKRWASFLHVLQTSPILPASPPPLPGGGR